MGTYSSMQTSWQLRADTPTEVIEAVRWLIYPERRGAASGVNTTSEDTAYPRCKHAFWQHPRAHQIGEDYCIHASAWDQTWWLQHGYYGFELITRQDNICLDAQQNQP